MVFTVLSWCASTCCSCRKDMFDHLTSGGRHTKVGGRNCAASVIVCLRARRVDLATVLGEIGSVSCPHTCCCPSPTPRPTQYSLSREPRSPRYSPTRRQRLSSFFRTLPSASQTPICAVYIVAVPCAFGVPRHQTPQQPIAPHHKSMPARTTLDLTHHFARLFSHESS